MKRRRRKSVGSTRTTYTGGVAPPHDARFRDQPAGGEAWELLGTRKVERIVHRLLTRRQESKDNPCHSKYHV
eukprot:819512-Prymnesium_polylepis.2